MPKFIIERSIPGVGKSSLQELQDITLKSNQVFQELGPKISWLHSYVTDDKVYCVYVAPDEKLIRDHAKKGGFPADKISQIHETLDAAFADKSPAKAEKYKVASHI
jgi:hypothetical protein